MSNLKVSLVALAVGTAFSGVASATYVAGAGASAQRSTAITEWQNSASCGGGAITTINANTADGGSNVRAIRCNSNGNIFSYDSDGGSWRAYATNYTGADLDNFQAYIAQLALENSDTSLKQVRYLDLSLCPADVCAAGAAKPVLSTNTGTAPKTVSIGFTDVNPAFFDGTEFGVSLNRPRDFVGWKDVDGTLVSTFPSIGLVFGVATSRSLYEALMNDQGITLAARPECYIAGLANLALEACAPVITRQQYAAMANTNAGSLNKTYNNLFLTSPTIPALAETSTTTLERRDWGSGTQASSNWYFFGVGCSGYFDTPAAFGDVSGQVITENNATADVVTRLSVANVYRIGILGREGNNPAAGGAWGFVKLAPEKGGTYTTVAVQGAYPTNNNAVRGLYDYWTVAWTFCQLPTTDPGILSMCQKLNSTQGTYSYTGTVGTINLKAKSPTAIPSNLATTTVTDGSYFRRSGMIGQCNTPTSF